MRLSLYYPEIWDAYQSLVFETVVNGPHQEPEGPQILESMKKKKKKLDDELPRPKTAGTRSMFKTLAVFRISQYFPRNRFRGSLNQNRTAYPNSGGQLIMGPAGSFLSIFVLSNSTTYRYYIW
jgi:hypothetical protein